MIVRDGYLWVKMFHLNLVMLWMVGMFALPWLFVFHRRYRDNPEITTYIANLEHKLLRYFINPCLIITFCTGLILVWYMGGKYLLYMHWFQFKLVFLVMMFLTHGIMSRYRKAFIRRGDLQSQQTYVMSAVLSMLLMIAINYVVLIKPF